MEVEDSESVEYIESIFRLLKAYPETLTNVDTESQSASAALGRVGVEKESRTVESS